MKYAYAALVVSALMLVAICSIQAQFTSNSELSDGELYKLGLAETGMYKISYGFLKDELGIDIDNVNPRNIRILYDGGGMLPLIAGEKDYDDLPESHIQIVGEEDGSFDNNDYILFYANGADEWKYSPNGKIPFNKTVNAYTDVVYCFLKIDNKQGKRVQTRADLQGTVSDVYSTSSFDDYQFYGEENTNLLYDFGPTEGSGQMWFSDAYRVTRQRDYSFEFPNLLTSEDVQAAVSFAARSGSFSAYTIEGGGVSRNKSLSGVSIEEPVTSTYARIGTESITFKSNSNIVRVDVSYPQTTTASEGWLDYVAVNARRALQMTGSQMPFRDSRSLSKPYTAYQLSTNSQGVSVWDVSNPVQPLTQLTQTSGANLSFVATSESLREFISFNKNEQLLTPVSGERIENQNIHSLSGIDMIVLYHPEFIDQVEMFRKHRESHSGITIAKVEIQQLFNEFSCGRQDPAAIRDFLRMLYLKNAGVSSVLLFGDGSFDYKNNLGLSEDRKHHFIPTFETINSTSPLSAFPSDDFFVLLEDGEGGEFIRGSMDMAIGRFPVKTPAEARGMVQKIIDYDTNKDFMRDWRNRVVFIGDDEDRNLHFRDSEELAKKAKDKREESNLDKIYLDAYREVSTTGGSRYPDANAAINRNIFRGALVMNYLGHGGPTGWAQERILTTEDIRSWSNSDQYPVMITATCSFTGFDEPNFESAGERCVLNPDGGVVALMTTVRAVFAHANKLLVSNCFNTLFTPENGEYLTLGETVRRGSNALLEQSSGSTTLTNVRKFALIGDPSMKLAIPPGKVYATSLNGVSLDSPAIDTLGALTRGVLEGYVADANGNELIDFNGTVYMTLFDKEKTVFTLGQNSGSNVAPFNVRNTVLFKGSASVTNGKYSIEFILPKDINYEYGYGRISMYAQNGDYDAAGYSDSIVVGGTDANAVKDDQGPIVDVFMDSENFALGGITDPDPVLLVKLKDDFGINISNSSVGHELTAILDEDQANPLLLNDFYEANVDDFTGGQVRFPLFNLEEGRHTVRVKAWDISNNSAEGFTEFIVAGDENVALERVINYPNPFTTRTCFEFEHNHAGSMLDIQVRVYTVGGTLVKTLYTNVLSEGSRINCSHGLVWDGRDDYGDQLARGVYVYKVSVRVDGLDESVKKAESEFEKLVILK